MSRVILAGSLLSMALLCAAAGLRTTSTSQLKEQRMGQIDKDEPRPDPKLEPGDVVQIVLEALRQNDSPVKNHGIAVTFSFASPGNRAVTGPLDRFIELVNNLLYRPMLNHRHAEQSELKIAGDFAQQKVTITDAVGRKVIYLFTLSKQHENPYKDCWMTEGVERLSSPDEEENLKVARSNGNLRQIRA